MKVRWTSGSLRLRITPGELDAVRRGDPLRQRLDGPGGGWTVAVDPRGASFDVRWDGATATVELAATDIARLADPGCEGVYSQSPGMRLIVEKDYPCAHPHAPGAQEPHTERFTPTDEYRARKAGPPDAA